jgi:thiamine transporter ThiT
MSTVAHHLKHFSSGAVGTWTSLSDDGASLAVSYSFFHNRSDSSTDLVATCFDITTP